MNQQIKWNWWGTWLIDYCSADDAYEAYDIWEKAYLEANPQLSDAREALTVEDNCDAPGTTLDLLTNHYHQSMRPFWNSWMYDIWWLLHLPVRTIDHIIWTIKRLFS
jgi:hypothetical protein